MVRGKSLFVSLLVACGASSAPTSAPTNHAAPVADCALTGEVIDNYTHEPPKGASVVLIGPGMPREVQRTDDTGHFSFPHAAGRTKVNAYFGSRSVEHLIDGCGEVKLELPSPPNVIDI